MAAEILLPGTSFRAFFINSMHALRVECMQHAARDPPGPPSDAAVWAMAPKRPKAKRGDVQASSVAASQFHKGCETDQSCLMEEYASDTGAKRSRCAQRSVRGSKNDSDWPNC